MSRMGTTSNGAPLDELRAIAFLRALIHQPTAAVRGAGIDQGWCANEHAAIAQMALRAVGLEANIARGTLAFFDFEYERRSFQTLQHQFIVLEGEAPQVFDSAATLGEVEGVPLSWATASPGLMVLAFGATMDGNLVIPHYQESARKLACYFVEAEEGLETEIVTFKSESRFGQWLDERFQDQEMIWGKVIGTCIRMLERKGPEPPFPLRRTFQDQLWEWVDSLPDQRDFVADRLWV